MDEFASDLLVHRAKRIAIFRARVRELWSEPKAPERWAEADFLALDADGGLLVIEVKRGNDRRLGWTPAQVAYYAALFRRWASEAGPAATETHRADARAARASRNHPAGAPTGRSAP
jgi:hypothetical protein